MSARTHLFKKLIALLSVSFCAMANASYFGIDLVGDRQGERNWNPRTGDGLVAVVSGEIDWTENYTRSIGNSTYSNYERWIARAAAYGSDSSSGDGVLDPRLKGYAIEPMADVQASYSSACRFDGDRVSCDGGVFRHGSAAWASVDHRVVQRANILPEIKTILDSLASIPVYLDFALSTRVTAVNDYVDTTWSLAKASFALTQGNNALFWADATSNETVAGRWQITLKPSTTDLETLYTIGVWAEVEMALSAGDQSNVEGQAIADPFLFVDPAWEYAEYFVVQQESTLHPGEWVEVTRSWRESTTSIPEPGSLCLLLTGVGLLSSGHRRAKKGRILPKLVDERA